jgi:hypothetical protein
MRVEVDLEGGKSAAGLFVHKRLPAAMGNSVAAFAAGVLAGGAAPGVWYPEEKEAVAVGLGLLGSLSCWDGAFGAACFWARGAPSSVQS